MAHFAATGQVHVSWRMEIICEGAHDGLILVNTVQGDGDDGRNYMGQQDEVPAIDWQPDTYTEELDERRRERRHRKHRRRKDKPTNEQATYTDLETPADTSMDSHKHQNQQNGTKSNGRAQESFQKPHGMSITEVIDDLLDVKLNTFDESPNDNNQSSGVPLKRAPKAIVELPPDTGADTSWEDEKSHRRGTSPKVPVTLSETTTTTTTVEVFQTVHPANQPPPHLLQPNEFLDPNRFPLPLPPYNNQGRPHPQNGHAVQHNQHQQQIQAPIQQPGPYKMVRQTKETLINDPAPPALPQRRATSSRSSASTPTNSAHTQKAAPPLPPQAAPRRSKIPSRDDQTPDMPSHNYNNVHQTIQHVLGHSTTQVLDSNQQPTNQYNKQQIIRDPVTVVAAQPPKALRLSQSDLTVLSIVPACMQSETVQLSIEPDTELQSRAQRPKPAAHLETLIDDPAHSSQDDTQHTSFDSLDRNQYQHQHLRTPMDMIEAHSYGSNSALNISQSLARVQLAAPNAHVHFSQPDGPVEPETDRDNHRYTESNRYRGFSNSNTTYTSNQPIQSSAEQDYSYGQSHQDQQSNYPLERPVNKYLSQQNQSNHQEDFQMERSSNKYLSQTKSNQEDYQMERPTNKYLSQPEPTEPSFSKRDQPFHHSHQDQQDDQRYDRGFDNSIADSTSVTPDLPPPDYSFSNQAYQDTQSYDQQSHKNQMDRPETNARQEYQLATQLNRLQMPQDVFIPPAPPRPTTSMNHRRHHNDATSSDSREQTNQVQMRVREPQNQLVEDYFEERLEYFDRRHHSIYTIPEATSSVEGGLDRSAITSIASEDQLEPPDYAAPPPPSVTSKTSSRHNSDLLLKQATTRSALDAQRNGGSNRGSRHSSIDSERSSLSGMVRQASSSWNNAKELGSELDNLSDYNQGRLTPLAPEQFGSKESLTSRDSVISSASNKHDRAHAMYDRKDVSQIIDPQVRRVSDTGSITQSHYSSYASLKDEPTHVAQRVTRTADPDLQGARYGQITQNSSEHAAMLLREEHALTIRKPMKPTEM